MRIAIQLQSWDETVGGIGIYTQEIVRALLRIDTKNEYLLIYPAFGIARTRRGQFRCRKNVIEIETGLSRLPLEYYCSRLYPRARDIHAWRDRVRSRGRTPVSHGFSRARSRCRRGRRERG